MLPPISAAYAAWLTVCLVWGTTYLGIRVALETIPPFLLGGMRWLIAGLLLVAILKLRGEPLPARAAWPSLALIGTLMIGFGNGAVVWAEQTVPSGLAAVLVSTSPFWMIGVERLMPDAEAMTRRHVIGLLIGFAGIVVLVWPEIRVDEAGGFLRGAIATQLACAGWAVGSSYARRRSPEENVLAAVAIEMIAAGACLMVLAVALGEGANLRLNPRTLSAFLYLIVAGSIVGFSAYAYALKHLPVTTVSLYAYVNPVIAVVLGTIVLREPFSARIVAAGALVLAGTAIVRRT